MLLAAIDVGSNTLRLLIGSFKDGKLVRVHTGRAITRLAEGVRESGVLGEANIERSISALKDFTRSISEYDAVRVRAAGTSALREARNSEAFIERAYDEIGIRIEIISGTREAALTAKGVLAGFPETTGSSLIIDMGGGSTEWIVEEAGSEQSPLCGTVPLGVVNLLERFMKTDPPSEDDIAALNAEIDVTFRSGAWGVIGIPEEGALRGIISRPRFDRLIGTGGTITTLASMDLGLKEYDPERVHMHSISLERLRHLKGMLTVFSLAERQQVAGLEAGRADLIIPGVLLTIRLVETLGFDEILVSDCGLLEGLLREMHDEERTASVEDKKS